MRFACLILVTLALAGTARAQPGLATAVGPQPKNPAKARALSIAVPLASMAVGALVIAGHPDDGPGLNAPIGAALIAGGTLVGPSVGLWYAGHPGGKGILLRSAALVLATGAFVIGSDMRPGDCMPFSMTPAECDEQERSYRNDQRMIAGMLVTGAAVYVASAVYDIHASGRVARRWNEDRGLTLAPTVMAAAGGGKAPGAVMSMRF